MHSFTSCHLLLILVQTNGKKNLYLHSVVSRRIIIAQVLPSALIYYLGEIGSVNGSSDSVCEGDIIGTTDRGLELICVAPTTAVLFDGNIPTLSLDSDVWASQLHTARHDMATAPNVQLTVFYDTLASTGAGRFELVMFNCPQWRIAVQTIDLQDIDNFGMVIGTANLTLTSCDSLVRVCIPVTTVLPQPCIAILLTFPDADRDRWVHLAEVTFYSSVGKNCVPETLFTPSNDGLPTTGKLVHCVS